MAWEYPVLDAPGQTAGADFSGTTGSTHGLNLTAQYLIAKLSADDTWVPASSLHDFVQGIIQGNGKSGDAAQIRVLGVSKVMCGSGGLSFGQQFGPDSNGAAVAKSPTNTGANYGDCVLGYCIEGAAAGALASVMITGPQVI